VARSERNRREDANADDRARLQDLAFGNGCEDFAEKEESEMSMHRRGRGEGSIVQRADGRWMARVDLGWQDGKRRSKAIYGRTRRAVADALQNALRAAQDGTLVADERQTVPAFLARWLQDVARTRVRPRTFVGYEAAIERHISPYLGRVRLSRN
jgi:hypothetical protein